MCVYIYIYIWRRDFKVSKQTSLEQKGYGGKKSWPCPAEGLSLGRDISSFIIIYLPLLSVCLGDLGHQFGGLDLGY